MLLKRQRGRELRPNRRGVGSDHPARIAGVGGRERTPQRSRRDGVEVVERRGAAEGEAGPLDEGAVGAERVGRVVEAGVVLADADGDVAAHRAVSGLAAGVGGDIAAGAHHAVVGGAGVGVVRERTPAGEVADAAPAILEAGPAADLQADVGARNVVEPCAVERANLHVLDRFGLDGKIGCRHAVAVTARAAAPPRRRLFTIFILNLQTVVYF